MAQFHILAEQSLLGLLLSREHDDLCLSKLDKSVWATSVGRSIFEAVSDDIKEHRETNLRSVVVTCAEKDLTTEVIRSLAASEYDATMIDKYIKSIAEHKAVQRLRASVARIVEKKDVYSTQDLLALKKAVDSSLASLDGVLNNTRINSSTAAAAIDSLLATNVSQKDLHTNSMGCSYLDAVILKGAKPQNITTIFGPTGGGKSTFAQHMFIGRLANHLPSLWVSTENDEEMLLERFVATITQTSVRDLQNPSALSKETKERIEALKSTLASNPNFELVYRPSVSMSAIREMVHNFRMKTGATNIVVFVDLFTMVKELKNARSAKEIESVVDDLHVAAFELNVHFAIILQSRRKEVDSRLTLESLYRRRPTIEEVKHSGAFSERSRVVLSVFNRRHAALQAFPEQRDKIIMEIPDCIEVCVAKQNQGETGTVIKYAFEGETFSLSPYVED